ncbi:MAG: RCC1 domain-containing protein [Caldilineaceae bacterium]
MEVDSIEPYPIYMFGIRPLSELTATLGSVVTITARYLSLVSDPLVVRLLPEADNEIQRTFYLGRNEPTPTPTSTSIPPPAASDTFTTIVPNRLISVGREHSCVITNIGALQCWGHNYCGQLGNGTVGANSNINRIYDEPTSVQGLNRTCAPFPLVTVIPVHCSKAEA